MRRIRLRRALVAALTSLAFLALPSASASAASVPYGLAGFAVAASAELAAPGSSPPGANDWACKPSAAHPDPVVLVHGASANMTENWQAISPLLAANGYCVFALTYGVPAGTPFPFDQIGGRNPMEQSAGELSAFVDRVLAATGATKVDIVGHSEGSLMPDYYVKFLGGAAKVARYVGMTPLWNGSNVLALAQLYNLAQNYGLNQLIDPIVGVAFASSTQFLTGSAFLAHLDAGSPAVPGVSYTMIMTKNDEAVVPYTSGFMNAPNATNVVLQDLCQWDGSGHAAVAYDPNAAQVVLNALDPANAEPVICQNAPLLP